MQNKLGNSTDKSGSSLNIGAKLRSIRTGKGFSQRELARRAGVTNGFISQIEQNISSPSVSSLKRILDAIPLTLAEFFATDSPTPGKIFYSASELLALNHNSHDRGAENSEGSLSLRQVGDLRGRKIQLLQERYGPGADTGLQPYSHDAEEVGIVISGEIELTVGAEIGVLGPGDAYLFDSNIPHRFRNKGQTECIIISACTPPSF